MKFSSFSIGKTVFILVNILALFCIVKLYKYTLYNNALIEVFAASDVSIHKPITCNIPINSNIWLISYADGENYIANQNGLLASSINKCIDFTKAYRKKHISPAYFEAHKSILSQKRGAGYWLWKPYLILKTLNEIPENDVLFYIDAGVLINIPIDTLIGQLLKKDIMIFDQGWQNKELTKRLLFQMMDMDFEETWNANHLQANVLLIKNTPFARNFIAEWLYWAEKPEAITDILKGNEFPEFVDHRHDQSILSILYLKYKDKINILPSEIMHQYFLTHRRADFKKRSLVFSSKKPNGFESKIMRNSNIMLGNEKPRSLYEKILKRLGMRSKNDE